MIHEIMTNFAILWKQFKNNFCDDLSRQLQNLQDVFTKKKMLNQLFNYEFYKIDEILNFMNKTFADYAMLIFVHNWIHNIVNSLINRELNYDSNIKQKLRDEYQTKFNVDQVECFDKIITIVNNHLEIVYFFFTRFSRYRQDFCISNFMSSLQNAKRYDVVRDFFQNCSLAIVWWSNVSFSFQDFNKNYNKHCLQYYSQLTFIWFHIIYKIDHLKRDFNAA